MASPPGQDPDHKDRGEEQHRSYGRAATPFPGIVPIGMIVYPSFTAGAGLVAFFDAGPAMRTAGLEKQGHGWVGHTCKAADERTFL